MRNLKVAGVVLEVVVNLLLTFNMVFGARKPSEALCDDWDSGCLERSGDFSVRTSQIKDSVEHWEGLLFIGGTCIALTAAPWLVLELLTNLSGVQVEKELDNTLKNVELQENFAHSNHFEQQPALKGNKVDTRSISPHEHFSQLAQDDQRVFDPVGKEAAIVKEEDNPRSERPVIVSNRRANAQRSRGSVNVPLHSQ
jgi:hypothetical protein